jgi:hypothetical protein
VKRQSQKTSRGYGIGRGTRIGAATCIAAAAVAASLPSAAHHSFSAEFDSTKEIRATGAVTQLDWQNPHAWIHLGVTEICERSGGGGGGARGGGGADGGGARGGGADGGGARGGDADAGWACRTPGSEEGKDWAFELGSPNGLMRQGWTRSSLKPGDVVTILGSRARDGSTNSNARSVTTADGKRMFAGSSENVTP